MGGRRSIVIVGGCGHVGLPLAALLAESENKVTIFDIDPVAVEVVMTGRAPFMEAGLDEKISQNLNRTLFVSCDASVISNADVVIVVIGTPLDIRQNPDPTAVVKAIEDLIEHLRDNQLLILRSTVFPGVTQRVEEMLNRVGRQIPVAFCPERIVEGAAIQELRVLPQIIGVRDEVTYQRASEVFCSLGVKNVMTSPEEAELAKLFTNAWRYIKFAAANQFYMIANSAGVDYDNIREAIRFEYPRAIDLPSAGFSAGPCLYKDTMQLQSFFGNSFLLGNAAMLTNEGVPDYIVDQLKLKFDLKLLTVGILGMAFKGDSDDIRSSLSYRLKRLLRFEAKQVLTSDPFVTHDEELVTEQYLLRHSDVVILASPHSHYKSLVIDKPLIDIWNHLGKGTSI